MSWPAFFSLQSAWLLLLAIPLVIFYFLKLKRPQLQVSSLALWRRVINDQRVNSPFQRFKRNVLLWLQLAALALVCLAAMQPFWNAAAKRAKYIPVLIDHSASMGAMTSLGKTRLQLAKERVLQMVEDLLPDQRISLVSVGATARRLTDFTDDRRELKRALSALEPVDVPSDIEDGLRMTQSLALTVPVSSVILHSDGNLPPLVNFDLPFPVSYQRIDEPVANVGITGASARRAGMDAWELFVQVAASNTHGSAAKIVVKGNDSVWGEDYVRLDSGESKRIIVPVTTSQSARVEVELIADGMDGIASDNRVRFELPVTRSLVVHCPESLGSLRHALRGIPALEIHPQESSATPGPQPETEKRQETPQTFDLYITDKVSEQVPDARLFVTVGIVPQPLRDHIAIQSGSTSFVDWDRQTQLLRHVQLSDVLLGNQVTLSEGSGIEVLEELGYQSLADGTTGPLILEKRTENQLRLHFLFHPDRSTLAYRVGFPILMANLVNLTLREASLAEVRPTMTGVLPPQSLTPNTEYTVTAPDGQKSFKTGGDGLLAGISASKVGEYRIQGGSDPPLWLAANLLSPLETSLSSQDDLQFRELTVRSETSAVRGDQPLWRYLAIAAFGVLLVEWWYFHRPHGVSASAGWVAFVLILVGSWGASAIAQDGTMAASVHRSTSAGRSGSPTDVAWQIDWSGTTLVEGTLEMQVVCDDKVLSTSVLEDVVLTTGEQTFRMGSPTAGSAGQWNPVEANLRLIGKDRTWDLGRHLLPSETGQYRLTIGICGADRDLPDPFSEDLADSLALERFSKGLANEFFANHRRRLFTTLAYRDRDDIPEDPLRLTQYDILVLSDPCLPKLAARQFEAIEAWLQAGGSLCVVVSNKIPAAAVDFLNRLGEGDDRMPTFSSQGLAPAVESGSVGTSMWMRDVGWGRVAILDREGLNGLAASWPKHTELVSFLWRLRKDIQTAIENREWEREAEVANVDQDFGEADTAPAKSRLLAIEHSGIESYATSQLAAKLLPSDVRLLPPSYLTWIAMGYILLIGPVDFLVLGMLRRRRWTWITFPVATIATALFVIWLAHQYMSGHEKGHALILRDLDAAGRVVMENRIELQFAGRAAYATRNVTSGIFTPLSDQWLEGMYGWGMGPGLNRRSTTQDLRIAGRYPSQYRIRQWLEQWTPVLSRELTIRPQRDAVVLPVDDLSLDGDASDISSIYRFAEAKWSSEATVILLRDDTMEVQDASSVAAVVRSGLDSRSYLQFNESQSLSSMAAFWGLLQTSKMQFPWFHRSPSGGDSFDDLQCSDRSNVSQSPLLLLAVMEAGDLIVYRLFLRETTL
jgi:Ca-activated chloride channel homolog